MGQVVGPCLWDESSRVFPYENDHSGGPTPFSDIIEWASDKNRMDRLKHIISVNYMCIYIYVFIYIYIYKIFIPMDPAVTS
jgi:hypothetical protein